MHIYIYMESRKMIQVNLFTVQEWSHRYREHTCGHGEGWGGREDELGD